MGNKLGRRRQVVDEKYTKPQGLYQHKDVDHKKLRKLILESKLAPCYPGDDDCSCDLEECPICFLYYPSLNRSRCCMKGICTECFLQMKTPNSTRPTQCPFCKTPNYAVEYRGVKTKEEKGLEQLEEQRVIEAKIRMRQKELLDEEERMLKKLEIGSSSSRRGSAEVDYCSASVEIEENVDTHETDATSVITPFTRLRQNRDEDFDIDLEDIMVMEAIWLSIQESERHQDPTYCEDMADVQSSITMLAAPVPGTSFPPSSSSSGLACAIAALAERQQANVEATNGYTGEGEALSSYNTPCCSRYSNRESINYFQPDSSSHMIRGGDESGHWFDHTPSEVAEVGTSYGGSDEVAEAASAGGMMPLRNENGCGLRPSCSPIVPESFEEQVMLAMAVSLADARAAPGVSWR